MVSGNPGRFQERLGGFRPGGFRLGVDLRLFGGRQPPLMLGRVMIQAKVHLV